MRFEFKLIENLKKIIGREFQGPLGIGDDAALLPEISAGRQWILSTDVLVEKVDFRLGEIPPEMAGRKALAVNLSDIAAMGGMPSAFVISLGIPPSFRENWIRRFYRGMMRLARQNKTACLGGDISRSREFFASIAILGHVKKNQAVTRARAKSGDLIYVTGKLGGSILRHHYEFIPRLSEAKFLCDFFRPTTMIDISDGLLQDLGHILKASKVGARLDLARIPVSSDARKLARTSLRGLRPYGSIDPEGGRRPTKSSKMCGGSADFGGGQSQNRDCFAPSPRAYRPFLRIYDPIGSEMGPEAELAMTSFRHALTDGEDFELLFTLPRRFGPSLEKKWKKRFPRLILSRIGEIISQKEKLIYEWNGKKIKPPRFSKKGFSHF